MNIFVLDKNPEIAAKYHCDKHVLKMILESGQMLSTAHWMAWLDRLGKSLKDFRIMRDAQDYLYKNVPEHKQPPWKMTHVNHPCSIWSRDTFENYMWHSDLGLYLCREYTFRYKKIHKGFKVHMWLQANTPPGIKKTGLTPFKICMKDEYKISNDPFECYREYYIKDKVRFAKWKNNNQPEWWIY
jgi:hypothetical protein